LDRDRLKRLLGGVELAWLVNRIRTRLERGQTLHATVTLTDATAAQRAAVHRLLGRRPHAGGKVTVSLDAVDDVLRRSGACEDGLESAVVALTGPVTAKAAAAAKLERAWQEAFAPLEETVGHDARLASWYSGIRDTGLVRRLTVSPEAARPLLLDLAKVVRSLPGDGEPLGHFAARVTGRAHALDDDRPLATLALGAARALSGIAAGSGSEWRREVWASVGLLRDDVSSTVLTLGLPGDSRTPNGRALAAWRQVGQPVVLTLRQLVRDPPDCTAQLVSVCENPVVVTAAADRLGSACRPLVCTSGQPVAAVTHLLRLLTEAGAELRYHGDFDWGGLRIANAVIDRFAARPWRFDTASYLSVAARGHVLTGKPVTAQWDDDLTDALRTTGKAVEEELVLNELITDLRKPGLIT
jgi:uncharacterized protein (TIGR02679 family)